MQLLMKKNKNTCKILKYMTIFFLMNIYYVFFFAVLLTQYNMYDLIFPRSLFPYMYAIDKKILIFSYVAIIIPSLFFYLFFNKLLRFFLFFSVLFFHVFKYFDSQPQITLFIVTCFSFSVLSCHVLLYLLGIKQNAK